MYYSKVVRICLLICFLIFVSDAAAAAGPTGPKPARYITTMCKYMLDDCITMLQSHYGISQSNSSTTTGTIINTSPMSADPTLQHTPAVQTATADTAGSIPQRNASRYQRAVMLCEIQHIECLSSLQAIEDRYQEEKTKIIAPDHTLQFKIAANAVLYLLLVLLAMFGLCKWLMPSDDAPGHQFFRRCMTCTLLVERPVVLVDHEVQPPSHNSPQDDMVEFTAAQHHRPTSSAGEGEPSAAAQDGDHAGPFKLVIWVSGDTPAGKEQYPSRLAVSVIVAMNIAVMSCVLLFMGLPTSQQLQGHHS